VDLTDRWGVLFDLFECESNFQQAKSNVLRAYLEAYEHAVNPTQVQAIATNIMELARLRPHLDLKLGHGNPPPATQSADNTHQVCNFAIQYSFYHANNYLNKLELNW
jgi:hypothetical protein